MIREWKYLRDSNLNLSLNMSHMNKRILFCSNAVKNGDFFGFWKRNLEDKV